MSMTDFLFRWWWLALMVAYIAIILLVCHVGRATDRARLWWWRR